MRGWNSEVLLGHILSGLESTRRGYLDAPTNGLGLNPAFPQGAGHTPLQPGVPVSIDFMVNIEGYMADATRIFCLGEPSLPYRKIHQDLLALNRELTTLLKPGKSGQEIFAAALQLAEAFQFSEFFLGYREEQVNFVGHGIGLEVDEFPFIARRSAMELESGMIVALEPKLIIPPSLSQAQGIETGLVAIENTYLVAEHAPLCLTRCPEEIRVLSGRD